MTNALTIYNQFDQIQQAAAALEKSGYFKDVTSQAQAIVKVMAGAELGLPPFASMTGISIIQGKPTLGANVIATLVKNDPRYNYRVMTCTNEACTLEWFENGRRVGESGFTIQEAKAAGLTGKDNWQKYPSDMLFARAITRGTRRHAPGIFGGSPIYTPDELGADVDPEGYIDATARDVTHEKATPETIIKELGYEPEAETPAIVYPDDLCKIVDSKGVRYVDKTDAELSNTTIGIAQGLAKPGLTDEQKAGYEIKRNAIVDILRLRHPG